MTEIQYKTVLQRWLVLATFAAPPACVGFWMALSNRSPMAQASYYYAVWAIAVALPFVDRLRTGWSWSWHLSTYVPTVAAMTRTAIAAILGLTPLVRAEPWVSGLAFGYLGYFTFFALNYTLAWYHASDTRWVRVAADLVFAALIVVAWDPLCYPSWLVFLLPIITTARSYTFRWALTATAGAVATTAVVMIYGYPHTGVESAIVWSALTVAVVTYVVPLVVYHDEKRNRLGAVQSFARDLWLARQHRPGITRELVAFLTYHTNSELVLAVRTDEADSTVVYCWHTSSSPLQGKCGHLSDDAARRLRGCQADIDATANLPTAIPQVVQASIKRVARTLHQSDGIKARLWRDLGVVRPDVLSSGFADLRGCNSNGVLNELETWIRQTRVTDDRRVDDHLTQTREADPLYKKFRVVAVLAIEVPGWSLYFINNFPQKFKRVPRAFWADGVEKVQIAKMLLS